MSNDPQPAVDAIDLAMLELLAQDARITNQRLAESVGVAPSTALARLRSLRERGVIRGFHAEVDLAALGRPLQALIAVRLAVHAREQIDAFTDTVRTLPGVLMVFHLTGVTDYLVWVASTDAAGPAGVRRRSPRDPSGGLPRRDVDDLRASPRPGDLGLGSPSRRLGSTEPGSAARRGRFDANGTQIDGNRSDERHGAAIRRFAPPVGRRA